MIQASEASLTAGEATDEGESNSSAALAYSNVNAKTATQSSDKKVRSSQGLGRTTTGFSTSTNFSNQSMIPKKQGSASGVVML